ncbi:hypothetical protein T4B_13137 [Trichinella pseudospiralis]|uniref:Uncharacterized protein n=1 Tax=Trichinella pseudospiralis TaxID=6337 RepID=A0A0V1IZK5_TRIPS|nr:hypothetical protein T4B_13137 [Trichinella pseudospiralis]
MKIRSFQRSPLVRSSRWRIRLNCEAILHRQTRQTYYVLTVVIYDLSISCGQYHFDAYASQLSRWGRQKTPPLAMNCGTSMHLLTDENAALYKLAPLYKILTQLLRLVKQATFKY